MNDVVIRCEKTTIQKDDRIRQNIVALEANIRHLQAEHHLPDIECPLTHIFAPGMYGRQIFVPADTLVVAKIHRHAHLVIVMKGRGLVATEEGPKHYEGPSMFVSKAGTKRVVYVYEDTVWATVHLTNETDLDKIEDELIAPDYASLDAMDDPDVRQVLDYVRAEVTP